MTRLIAFLDESKKPVRDRSTGRVATGGDHYYVVAAATVFASDLGDVRAQLSDIEAGLGYKLHYGDLSHKRRVEAIEAVEAIDGWDGYIFETARPLSSRHYTERHVRAKTLIAAFVHMSTEGGVAQVVLETRADPKSGFDILDQHDHQVLQRLLSRKEVPEDLRISHDDKTEKVLQIADLLAGARSDFLCGINVDVYPLIGHRIQSSLTVFDKVP